jgi:S-adenosylmethionine:tRNA ribosyltransferase-isomerase
VSDLPGLVAPGTVVVLNDTRVRKARLFAQTATGRKVEVLLLNRRSAEIWEALLGRAGKLRAGKPLGFAEGVRGTIESADADVCLIRFHPAVDDPWLERNGHVPLPPYVRRPDAPSDEERYQTVYSRVIGSAAAPTAGLHFTDGMLKEMKEAGAQVCRVTLHVGLGTFLPIRSAQIEEHRMHEETYSVPRETKELVDAAVRGKRPILAVGTTVVRTLETAWTDEGLAAGEGSTRIYITPGYRFKAVTQLFTNFHTPESSLLVLASAFAGRELILETYAEAIRKRYRFFSFGDAMLIR